MKALAVLLAILWFPQQILSQETNGQDSLEGATNFYVLIEDLPPAPEGLNLTSDELLTIIELSLRVRGIAIRPPHDGPFLYANVNVLSYEDPGSVVYNTKIEFTQNVLLDTDRRVWAVTWDASAVGYAELDGAKQAIQNSILELLAGFADDFLASNPR